MKKNETIQNYLEAIYIISFGKDNVRAIDVVKYLGYSRPTVSIALKQLESEKYIEIENNNIALTKKGSSVAKTMYERHECIASLLIKLGVNPDTAYKDACLVEHDLSQESFNAIKKISKKL